MPTTVATSISDERKLYPSKTDPNRKWEQPQLRFGRFQGASVPPQLLLLIQQAKPREKDGLVHFDLGEVVIRKDDLPLLQAALKRLTPATPA